MRPLGYHCNGFMTTCAFEKHNLFTELKLLKLESYSSFIIEASDTL